MRSLANVAVPRSERSSRLRRPARDGRWPRVLAGERRAWRVAALTALPLVTLIFFYCAVPRSYYTGTNSVEDFTGVALTRAHDRVCIPDLHIPAGTTRVRLRLRSASSRRPTLDLALTLAGQRPVTSTLAPRVVGASHLSTAVFTIAPRPFDAHTRAASACLSSDGLVNWLGTPRTGSGSSPVKNGRYRTGAIAIWYLPPAGAESSYLARAGQILERAALFRPGFVGPWLYIVLLFLVLPLAALAAVRCLALAIGGSGHGLARWVYAIAALNFICWALITPVFNAPDEVDHFAYTQSLLERGSAPARSASSPLRRWSSAETLALEGIGFFTDHQVGDSRLPWRAREDATYRQRAASTQPSAEDGGGNETAATHGPIYYLALAPAYAAASSSTYSQLTLMRLTSALIGALAALFAFLLARELAPRTPWLWALAGLLVAYQPMFGFISGSVNNDVGVDAGAAAAAFLLVRMMRRGLTLPSGLATGGLLALLPLIKGTAFSLYPVAGLAVVIALRRHHRRADVAGWSALLAGGALVLAVALAVSDSFVKTASNSPGVGASVHSTGGAFAHPLDYLAYVWQVFLPRLPFMAQHFTGTGWPAFKIFDERGWGAFGWYDVLFAHWVYALLAVAMLATPLLAIAAARRHHELVHARRGELAVLALTPLAVVAGFEAAFYKHGARSAVLEFGRYTFTAIAPLAVLVAASLGALARRRAAGAAVALLVCAIALSYASQLLTLTAFYA